MTSSTSGSTSDKGPPTVVQPVPPKRVPLQRKLSVGIIIALSVITLFFVMTTALFRDIERFVDLILTPDIRIARLYERCGNLWNQIDDQVAISLADISRVGPLINEELLAKFEGTLAELDGIVTIPERRVEFLELTRLAASYTHQLAELDRHNRRRGEITRIDAQKRTKAAQAISARTTELSKRFKRMLEDATTTLNSPEFQQSLGNTSSMLTTISKIEKDLQVVEAEIGLYVVKKADSVAFSGAVPSRINLPDRIQKRLQSILGLLTRSLEETNSPIQKRVLGKIHSSINDFKASFLDLREMLERPDSEKIEIDDLLTASIETIKLVFEEGQRLIASEADAFWFRIHATSTDLVTETKRDFYLSFVFLAVALGSGLYILFTFPRRVAEPLQQLKKQVRQFKLGDSYELEPIESESEEIYSLGESFRTLTRDLSEQAKINKDYLKTIPELTDIFREFEVTRNEHGDGEQEFSSDIDRKVRFETAVGKVLSLLRERLPSIGLLKVMIRGTGPTNQPGYWRLGEPVMSDEFRNSPEFAPYMASVGTPVTQKHAPSLEFIPASEGLTGGYFEDMKDAKISTDDGSFFRKTYNINSIQDNPLLRKRTYEQGLEGSLHLEPLKPPESDSDEYSRLMQPEYLGVLFVYFPEPDTMLSLQDMSFIKIIADQISALIETDNLLKEKDSKERIEYQLSMAKEIQGNLLPRATPNVPGVKICSVSKSAGEVGGDYYDFFELGPHRFGIVIADVSGKNVPAAIIMTVFKMTLSMMDLAKLSAAGVLVKANEIIQKHITPDRFITAMYVIIDTETGDIELACAGHNPAILARPKGEPKLGIHTAKGIPLGIMDMAYETKKFTMQPGDMLVMYTDGVTEARNPEGEEYEESRLKRFLSDPRSTDPAAALLDSVIQFIGDAEQ
ncbi:PP2C family protein-serine/threonine phosphatase, partial [Candidatus Ozemobacteraceae bacterium]|nr:PP2C family protein-serine/threonine phosphatase [Candidatus Ozemobacteraceae bacterium]